MPGIEIDFLEQGGQPPEATADRLAEWISEARQTLEVAIYDFHAREGAARAISESLEAALARGVGVRVVFNIERVRKASAPRPPKTSPQEIDGLNVPTRGVRGEGSLMHHKYAVRDGQGVWTGSTNWTDDSFGLEENVVLRIASPEVAGAYRANFEQLWEGGSVEGSGGVGSPSVVGATRISPFFSPRGTSLAHVVAERMGGVKRRIRVLSPVMTAGPILGTLAELARRDAVDLVGAYDHTQMAEVQSQWRLVPENHWKLEAWAVIAPRLSGKRSTPYSEDAVHDYMHAKVLVVGDEVLTGSYNNSRGGAENAENVVRIESLDMADRFASFAERVAERYRDG